MARADKLCRDSIKSLLQSRCRISVTQRYRWALAADDPALSVARGREILRILANKPVARSAVAETRSRARYAAALKAADDRHREQERIKAAAAVSRRLANEIRIITEKVEHIDAVNANSAHLLFEENIRSRVMSEVASNIPNDPTGQVLKRTWKNVPHEVIVLERGYTYNGQFYKSLSAIAKLITGTSWSGPVFFGLKSTPRVAKKAAERAAQAETSAVPHGDGAGAPSGNGGPVAPEPVVAIGDDEQPEVSGIINLD